MIIRVSSIVLLLFLQISILWADVLSQWRGPNRNGVYPEENLLKSWPENGPELLWKAGGVGIGFSSAAVTDNRIYVTGMIEGTGYLFAFSPDGNQLWKKSYGPEWDKGHPGARTTPTIVDNLIYLMSGYGRVVCLDTNGNKKWEVDLIKKFGARNLQWGMTESLLVDGDKVFCTPGGSSVMMAALDRFTGKLIWEISGNGEKSAYCSPVLVNHGKRRLILTMTEKSLVGLDADTGKFLWDQRHTTQYDINPNTPYYLNGKVLSVSGYGTTGAQLFEISADGNSIKKLWNNRELDTQMGAAAVVNGYIFASGHRNAGWKSLNWENGEIQFDERDLGGRGNIIFADGLLYIYSERGDLALVNPTPDKFDVISSIKIEEGSGPHWAHPVIKNGRLYLRHGEVLMVFNISH